jgi:hypothetical protein
MELLRLANSPADSDNCEDRKSLLPYWLDGNGLQRKTIVVPPGLRSLPSRPTVFESIVYRGGEHGGIQAPTIEVRNMHEPEVTDAQQVPHPRWNVR